MIFIFVRNSIINDSLHDVIHRKQEFECILSYAAYTPHYIAHCGQLNILCIHISEGFLTNRKPINEVVFILIVCEASNSSKCKCLPSAFHKLGISECLLADDETFYRLATIISQKAGQQLFQQSVVISPNFWSK